MKGAGVGFAILFFSLLPYHLILWLAVKYKIKVLFFLAMPIPSIIIIRMVYLYGPVQRDKEKLEMNAEYRANYMAWSQKYI